MSLVHPSIVGILRRRFVSTYFNAFPGPGGDAAASAYAEAVAERAGVSSLSYGAVVTPDGELVNRFGFERAAVASQFVDALVEQPRYAWFTAAETEVLRRADLAPEDVDAQLAAAKLWTELLQFDRARAVLGSLLDRELSSIDRERVRYARARAALRDVWRGPDPSAIDAELASITAPELATDVKLDRIALQIEKNPERGFFTGSRLRPGADAAAIAAELEALSRSAGPRAGEALHYLGVVRLGLGDQAGADAAWHEHYTRFPDDLLALASRLSHSAYKFSPNNGERRILGGRIDDEAMVGRIEQILKNGGTIQIMGPDGKPMSEERTRELLRRIRKR